MVYLAVARLWGQLTEVEKILKAEEIVDALFSVKNTVTALIYEKNPGLDVDTFIWCVGQIMCSGKTLPESLDLLGIKDVREGGEHTEGGGRKMRRGIDIIRALWHDPKCLEQNMVRHILKLVELQQKLQKYKHKRDEKTEERYDI